MAGCNPEKKQIRIPSRSFQANSSRVYPYVMDDWMQYDKAFYPVKIIEDIESHTEETRLESFVINCHGAPAYLDIADGGFDWDNLDLWKRLRYESGNPRVRTIYIVSCNVVSFGSERDGNLFCGAVAKNSGAYVIASNHLQNPSSPPPPKGYIDDYEGSVWLYWPDGSNRSWNRKAP